MPSDFEPFELPMEGPRVRGRSTENAHGRQQLVPLLREAQRRVGHSLFVEVGSWAGGSALEILEGVPGARLFCIDHWQGGPGDALAAISSQLGPKTIFQGFCRNVKEHLCWRIFPCVGKSTTWAAIWPFPMAAIYIDAAHDYDNVMADLEAWWPHVREGGLFIGHDFELFPGVKAAVVDWCGRVGLPYECDEELWWVWKPVEADNGRTESAASAPEPADVGAVREGAAEDQRLDKPAPRRRAGRVRKRRVKVAARGR